MKTPKKAYSLIEVLIAAALLSIILGALYMALTRAFSNQYMVKAKSKAKADAELILRQVQRDIAASLADYDATTKEFVPTFKPMTGGNPWEMKVADGVNPSAPPLTIDYVYDSGGKSLTRSGKVLSATVEAFDIVPTDNPIVLQVTVKTSAVAEGRKELQYIEQQVLVTIQAMAQANADPRWRDSKNVINNF